MVEIPYFYLDNINDGLFAVKKPPEVIHKNSCLIWNLDPFSSVLSSVVAKDNDMK